MTEEQMTIERAIRLLHPETTAEALAEIKCYHGLHGRVACVQAVSDACEFACEIMRDYKETKDALAGMEIMLTSAQSAAETWERKYKEVLSGLETATQERDRYWSWIREMGCETCSGDCAKCDEGEGWVWSGENQEAGDEHR